MKFTIKEDEMIERWNRVLNVAGKAPSLKDITPHLHIFADSLIGEVQVCYKGAVNVNAFIEADVKKDGKATVSTAMFSKMAMAEGAVSIERKDNMLIVENPERPLG